MQLKPDARVKAPATRKTKEEIALELAAQEAQEAAEEAAAVQAEREV